MHRDVRRKEIRMRGGKERTNVGGKEAEERKEGREEGRKEERKVQAKKRTDLHF